MTEEAKCDRLNRGKSKWGQVKWGQSRRDPRGHKKRPEACEGLRSTQGGGSGEGFTWWRDSGERDRRGRRYRCRRAPARTVRERRQVRRWNRRSRSEEHTSELQSPVH